MRLVNSNLNIACDVEENEVQVIVIENTDLFVECITDINSLIENDKGEFSLFDRQGAINWKKYVDIVINPWDIDFNSKRIKGTLYKIVAETANEKLYMDFVELKTAIISYMEDVLSSVPYGLNYSTEIDELSLYKYLDVGILVDDTDFLHKIIEYIHILASLCNVKVVFFVNLKTFLDRNSLLKVYEAAKYDKITIFLLENCEKEKLECEKITVIDKDYCIINY